MEIYEIRGDLFKNSSNTYLAHCISRDCKLGAGIALDFEKRYKLKQVLKNDPRVSTANCILVGKVFNLITKELYFKKPTYKSLSNSIGEMKEIIIKEKISVLSMPRIGSGLDGLSWDLVKVILFEVLGDLNLDVYVYYLED